MKVTRDYLRKVIKETIEEVAYPQEKYAIFIDESGELELVDVKYNIEDAKRIANNITDKIDNSNATSYERRVVIYKLVEV